MQHSMQALQLNVLDGTQLAGGIIVPSACGAMAMPIGREDCGACGGHRGCVGCSRREGQSRTIVTYPQNEILTGLTFSVIDKLGKQMVSLDITPGIENCPCCLHSTCFEICFARTGNYLNPFKIQQMELNSELVRSPQFVSLACDGLSRYKRLLAARIFGAGDLHSAECVRKLREIVRAFPQIRFVTNTHAWPIPEIWEELQKAKRERNWVIMLSLDRKLIEYYGPPTDDDFPRSWLAKNDSDAPLVPVDFAFRNRGKNNRQLPPMKTLGGYLVCPDQYDSFSKISCIACGICLLDKEHRNARIMELLWAASRSG